MKVRARVTKTNKFREVTIRDVWSMYNYFSENGLYKNVPAYLHIGRDTVSGTVTEFRGTDNWIFTPKGKNADLL